MTSTMPQEKKQDKLSFTNMSKRVLSKASERHLEAVAAKEELLTEIQHWLKSSSSCIAEIRETLNTLKNARALAKRDIHMARASIEIKLKELEADAEVQMSTMVKAEEETLMRSQKKLMDQKQKLERLEEILQRNLVGTELKKHIEEAKIRVSETRHSIVASKRQYRPTAVEFSIHDDMQPFLKGEKTLGTIRVKSTKGVIIRSSESSEALKKGTLSEETTPKDGYKNDSKAATQQAQHTKNTVTVRKSVSTRSRLDTSIDIVHDFERLIQLDINDVQPFFEVAANISYDNKPPEVATPTTTGKNKYGYIASKIDARNSFPNMVVKQTPGPNRNKSKQRSKSAHTRDKAGGGNLGKYDIRISSSAREDMRPLPQQQRNDYKPNMVLLNKTDFVSHEEQGPDQTVRKPKKEKMTVSYAEYDTIKEITLLQDDKIYEKPYPPDAYVDIFANPEPRKITSTTSNSSHLTVSSVTYKPSSAHASGPMYVPESEKWQSKSYFMYIARFHTKKHPHDTDLCRLTGIVALNNGQLVITDINHLKVMLFGPDFTYLSDIDCPSPSNVCVVKNDIVAVTLFHNRKLLLLKVCTIHLERLKEITVNCHEALYAVKCHINQYYVLCFAGHVHIIDESGKQMKMIETHVGSGSARNLEVDSRRKLLYISGLESVTCFFHTGDLNWQFTAKTANKNFNPAGIVLHNDRIFVTDWGNNRVLELSLDGTFVRDVITDNLEFPHAMAIQHSAGRLFITQSNMFRQEARSRSIKVFSVK